MTYEEAIHELYHQLPVFQRSGGLAYKPGLERTLELLEANGNPHKKIKSIHVAGTNGKGSVSHMLCSVMMEAGYSCGLFTSPHLVDFRERMKINGEMIDKEFIIRFTEKNKPLFDSLQPSFFEATTTLAFLWFAEKKTDICVIETGMGGRLDSTNVLLPLVSVITNVGMDHMQFLGNTIEEIAFEKAGIIKYTVPVIIGEADGAVKNVFETAVQQQQTTVFYAHQLPHENYSTPLTALYQQRNIKTVVQTCRVLQNNGFVLPDESIASGIKNVIDNTGLRGRYETISTKPRVIADAAHNLPGMQALMQQVKTEKYNHLHIVIGMARDKEITAVLNELPENATYYYTQASGERAMPAGELFEHAAKRNLQGEYFVNATEALKYAKTKASADDLILVTGSFFILAEILAMHN